MRLEEFSKLPVASRVGIECILQVRRRRPLREDEVKELERLGWTGWTERTEEESKVSVHAAD